MPPRRIVAADHDLGQAQWPRQYRDCLCVASSRLWMQLPGVSGGVLPSTLKEVRPPLTPETGASATHHSHLRRVPPPLTPETGAAATHTALTGTPVGVPLTCDRYQARHAEAPGRLRAAAAAWTLGGARQARLCPGRRPASPYNLAMARGWSRSAAPAPRPPRPPGSHGWRQAGRPSATGTYAR